MSIFYSKALASFPFALRCWIITDLNQVLVLIKFTYCKTSKDFFMHNTAHENNKITLNWLKPLKQNKTLLSVKWNLTKERCHYWITLVNCYKPTKLSNANRMRKMIEQYPLNLVRNFNEFSYIYAEYFVLV